MSLAAPTTARSQPATAPKKRNLIPQNKQVCSIQCAHTHRHSHPPSTHACNGAAQPGVRGRRRCGAGRQQAQPPLRGDAQQAQRGAAPRGGGAADQAAAAERGEVAAGTSARNTRDASAHSDTVCAHCALRSSTAPPVHACTHASAALQGQAAGYACVGSPQPHRRCSLPTPARLPRLPSPLVCRLA